MNNLRSIIALTTLLLVGLTAVEGVAQGTGTIAGQVTDSEGAGIPGATVAVLGTTRGGAADIDGHFRIPGVPAGPQRVAVHAIGYEPDTLEATEIGPGAEVRIEVQLATSAIDGEGDIVIVRGTASEKTTQGGLDMKRKARQLVEVTTAEEISASGASDAGDAVERQTGITTSDDRAIVRGLKPRYTSAQLNNISIPSPEPETKTLRLDLFPAGMIDNITTLKTFTPDNPGDFAGGLVKITTKDFPSRFILEVGVGSGFTTETQRADGLTYAGGRTDWLGFDDGTRGLPAEAAGIRPLPTNADEAALLRSFGDRPWQPETSSLPVDRSFSVTIGNRFGTEENPVGILFSTSYSSGYDYRQGVDRHPESSVNTRGERNYFYDYDVRETTRSTLLGSLLNLSYRFGDRSMIGFKGLFNHTSDDEATLVTGRYNASTVGEVRRTQLRFVERSVASGQLTGEHTLDFPTEGSQLEWRGAYSIAERSEPDNRQTAYLRSSGEEAYRFNGNFGSGNGRFFSELDDTETSAGLDLTVPLYNGDAVTTDTRLKVGTLNRYRTRSFGARRFVFGLSGESSPSDARLQPEELFTPEAVERGAIDFEERTTTTDAYDADEVVAAGYGMIETIPLANLRMILGARVELWDLNLTPFNQYVNRADEQLAVDRSVVDLLPSLTLIYTLHEEMNLRAAFSQTLARPEFRELAPFRFDDYRLSTFGNPTLERTRIQNYDLRWEWYPRAGELLAVTAFYKNFVNPIETFFLVGGSDLQVEPVNADGASSIGAELEVRTSLEGVADLLENITIGGNFTWTDSQVRFEEGGFVTTYTGQSISQKPVAALTNLRRPMQGQSPYVINGFVSWDDSDLGTELTVLFNLFGERLSKIGTEGFPDVYEQPRSMLDMTIRQRLPAGLSLSLKGKNLLDADIYYTQEFLGEARGIVETERWITGRSVSLGLSFSLDRLRLQQAKVD